MRTVGDRDVARIQEATRALDAKRIVLWGYKTPRHTHHWVMVAIHRALEFALRDTGLDVVWLDNVSALEPELLDDAIVLGNLNTDRVDHCMPLRGRATYISHDHTNGRADASRYGDLIAAGRTVFYRVYRGWGLEDFEAIPGHPLAFAVPEAHTCVMLWATDLLPAEIEDTWRRVEAEGGARRRNVVFVGTVWHRNQESIVELAQACADRGLCFEQFGRIKPVRVPWPSGPNVRVGGQSISNDEQLRRIREALLAPALQGSDQLRSPETGGSYVPCRIFKNISYGAFGLSNNPTVGELLGDHVVCDPDIGAMIDAGVRRADADPSRVGLREAMEHVAARHTYLDRLAMLLELAVRRREIVGGRARAPDQPSTDLRRRRLARRTVGLLWG